MIRRLAVLVVLSLPVATRAETLDSLLGRGPVVVVERDAKNRFASATAIIAVDLPLEKVWEAVIDFKHYSEFVPKVVKSEPEQITPTDIQVSWEIEVPGPNTKYKVLYHLDPVNHTIQADQVGGDLKGSHWSWKIEATSPTRTLVHYMSQARHFSSILESAEDEQQTITIGVNVGGALALLNALKFRLLKN